MILLLRKYLLSILFVLITLVLCFMNVAPLPAPPVVNFDKFVHSVLFLGLAGVIFFENTNYLRTSITQKRIFWGTFLFPVALGGAIEIAQGALTVTRSGDWYDFLFDIIGAIVGWGIALGINLLLKKKAMEN
jgi:VanZ family protein